MGSKGLKSLVISTEGAYKDTLADKEAFQALSRKFAGAIKSDGWSGSVLPDFGTASILSNSNFSGALPTLNAREGVFEHADKISGDAVADRIKERGGKRKHKGCSKCIINCSNIFVDKEGKEITSALEYETLWSMGAMLGIDDLDAIAQLDRLCDDIGLDSMNTGVAVAVAMDVGALEFGDSKAAIDLVKTVAQETEMGRLIGDGPDAVGKHFNHSRVPTVKGQSIAGYDPRAMPGMGVTYATSPMGADHTAGFVGGVRGPVETLLNTSLSSQVNMATVDSMGLCMFAQSGGVQTLCEIIAAVTGKPFTINDWQEIGLRCLSNELNFNKRAGLTEQDDQLPEMFHKEKLGPYHDRVPYPEVDAHGAFESLRNITGDMNGQQE